MTPDRPDAAQLLETAREVLKTDILPELPEDRRLDLLMVLSAMGLAGRTLADSADALPARQAERLAGLTGETVTAETQMDAAARLAAAIRAGDWDAPDAAAALHAALTADARDRLARANPKYLAAVEAETDRDGTPS